MCLERIPCSDGEMEDIKKHWKNAHFVKYNFNQLIEMSAEAEERVKRRRGWIIDDILEEVRERKEAEARKRAESGWMGIFRKPKTGKTGAETGRVNCFLCHEVIEGCEYNIHLETQHRVLFGVKEIMNSSEKVDDENVA